MTLALEYRPRKFSEVVSQRHVTTILRAAIAQDKVPTSVILSGSRGTGKTSIARIYAASLNCLNRDKGDACGECISCEGTRRGSNPSILEIDAASHGLVADARRLKELCSFQHEGRYRALIVDECQAMSPEAFQSLLKLLEEPPEQTAFIFLSTAPEKIPATIVSRSMSFELRRIPHQEAVDRLLAVAENEGIALDPALASEIVTRSTGSLRDSIMLLEQCSYVGLEDVAAFRSFFDLVDVSPDLFAAAMNHDFEKGKFFLEYAFEATASLDSLVDDLTYFLRDCLMALGGIPVGSVREFASRTRSENVVLGLKVLWDLKQKMRAVQDPRAVMNLGFILLCDALRPIEGKPIPKEETPVEKPKMTLEKMKEMLG